MKKIIFTILLLINSLTIFSQKTDYNLDNGFIAEGYDLVSYFDKSPRKGNKNFVYSYRDIKLKFSNEHNLNLFKNNPEKYIPKYGGWCAYALAIKSEKISINPETYEIRNGELYLFYNSWGTNTFNLWLDENPKELVKSADKNWRKIKYKKQQN